MTVIASTTFPQPDNTNIDGATLEVGGQLWSVIVGTADVQGHKFKAETGPDNVAFAIAEIGQADVTVTANLAIGPSGGDACLFVRATDANNSILVRGIYPFSFALYRIEVGTFVQIGT